MRLGKLEINEFRLFNNNIVNFGKYLTVISGHNAIGKSTILGLIGNSCELKQKDGTPIIQNQFKAEWSELFKGSKIYDVTGSNRLRISFIDNNNEEVDYRVFRTTWQKDNNGQDRFRIIPSRRYVNKKLTEAKIQYPVLFLGLGRLYPIGETQSDINKKQAKLNDTDKNWFNESYNIILKKDEHIRQIESATLSDFRNKRFAGIVTEKHDILGNSSGQISISQILMSVLSFIKLKENNNNWQGGILLIDELDATIHPAAQLNLVEFLYKCAIENNIQIIFTTHSLTILEYICRKIINNEDYNNDIELNYLTNSNYFLDVKRNIPFYTIETDIKEICSISNQNARKLEVFSEDEEARWFFSKLITKYLYRLKLVTINVGADALLTFKSNDPNYFNNKLLLLDGDKSEKIDERNKNNLNIICLPGKNSPEKVIYNYLANLDGNHEIYNKGFESGFTKKYLITEGPNSYKYSEISDERSRYKTWFKDNITVFEQLDIVYYWKQNNEEEFNTFIYQFVIKYNLLAQKNLLPLIKE